MQDTYAINSFDVYKQLSGRHVAMYIPLLTPATLRQPPAERENSRMKRLGVEGKTSPQRHEWVEL